jgi:hypothetical protein
MTRIYDPFIDASEGGKRRWWNASDGTARDEFIDGDGKIKLSVGGSNFGEPFIDANDGGKLKYRHTVSIMGLQDIFKVMDGATGLYVTSGATTTYDTTSLVWAKFYSIGWPFYLAVGPISGHLYLQTAGYLLKYHRDTGAVLANGGGGRMGIAADSNEFIYTASYDAYYHSFFKHNSALEQIGIYGSYAKRANAIAATLSSVYTAGDSVHQYNNNPIDPAYPIWEGYIGAGCICYGIKVCSGLLCVTGTRTLNRSVWKFDPSGGSSPIWSGDTGANTYDLAVDSSGHVYVAGTRAGNKSVWKFDPSGGSSPIWSYDLGAGTGAIAIAI